MGKSTKTYGFNRDDAGIMMGYYWDIKGYILRETDIAMGNYGIINGIVVDNYGIILGY